MKSTKNGRQTVLAGAENRPRSEGPTLRSSRRRSAGEKTARGTTASMAALAFREPSLRRDGVKTVAKISFGIGGTKSVRDQAGRTLPRSRPSRLGNKGRSNRPGWAASTPTSGLLQRSRTGVMCLRAHRWIRRQPGRSSDGAYPRNGRHFESLRQQDSHPSADPESSNGSEAIPSWREVSQTASGRLGARLG